MQGGQDYKAQLLEHLYIGLEAAVDVDIIMVHLELLVELVVLAVEAAVLPVHKEQELEGLVVDLH
jgi:hypothetical protein